MTWRRLLMLAFVVALLAAAVAGAAGYLAMRGVKKGQDLADCSASKCIPTLQQAAVVQALNDKGYQCKEESNGTYSCELVIGDSTYRVWAEQADGLISDISGTIRWYQERELSDAKKTFLLWLATIPYGGDEVVTAQIQDWLSPRLTGGKDVEAVVGGYRYELTVEKPESVALRIRPEHYS